MKEEFIGPSKIKKVVYSDRQTFLKKPVLKVEFEDGTKKEYTEEMYNKIVTPEQKTFTDLREAFANAVAEQLLIIFLESEMKVEDVEYTLVKTSTSLNQNLERATEKLWGKELQDRTLADIQIVLTKKDGEPKPTARKKSKSSVNK